MARSTYIYVVTRPIGGLTLAAFTVKWELIEWYQLRPGNRGEIVIRRFRDGEGYNDYTDVTKQIEEEAFS